MNARDRLIRCFASVFYEVDEKSIPEVNSTDKEWDSLKLITLINVVQQEFPVEIAADEIEGLNSFSAFLRKIEADSKN